jgi:hypothetical protein
MEAVVAIIKNLLKNTRIVFVLGVLLGLALGLVLGWGIWPVQWTDGNPEVLRADLQKDYLRMTIDSYNRTGDVDTAMARWDEMGTVASNTFIALQNDPGYLDQAEIQEFGVLVQSLKGPIQATTANEVSSTSGLGRYVLYASIAVVVILLAVGGLYLFRLFRKSSTVTPMMQAAEHSRNVERTDFQSLGLAAPITQTMTTYVLGDDLYDESFSIDTQGGDFLGEYGVGVSETIGVGEPKKVAALEIWLFDKNDIKTATKVLMSEHAYNDPNIRARLEPKGELVVVKPQEQVLLETATLQLLATVVDMDYGMGAMPQKSYFDRITLELAIWPRGGK